MRLEISCENRLGMVQDLLEVLVRHQVEVQDLESSKTHIYLNIPRIEFAEFQHLMPEIRLLNGVTDVKTVNAIPKEKAYQRLACFIKYSGECIVIIDGKGDVLEVSQAAYQQVGDVFAERGSLVQQIKGFNLLRWLEEKPQHPLVTQFSINNSMYQAELTPLLVVDDADRRSISEVFVRLTQPADIKKFKVDGQPVGRDGTFKSASMRHFIRDFERIITTGKNVCLLGSVGSQVERYAKYLLNLTAGHYSVIDATEASLTVFKQQLDELEHSPVCLVLRPETLIQARQKLLFERLQNHPIGQLISVCYGDLQSLVRDAQLNLELADAIGQQQLFLPPLNQRQEELADLFTSILKRQVTQAARSPLRFGPGALKKLLEYDWPMNERQAEQVIEQAIQLTDGDEIDSRHIILPEHALGLVSGDDVLRLGSLEAVLKKLEKDILWQLFPDYPSSRLLAPKLGLSHTAIANKLREYGINRKTVKVTKHE